ncbi:MAG: hypothetical protein WCQ48_02505 [Chloroflexota bacterium]
MRRVFGAIGVSLLVGGAAALTPLLAALGGGLTLTTLALGLMVWRWMRRSRRPSAPRTGVA